MKNLYPGINPHLNSRLQSPGGGWEMFHASFIETLARELDVTLPPNYAAFNEKSLQVTRIDGSTGSPFGRRGRTKPDIFVSRVGSGSFQRPNDSVSAPTLEFPVTDGLLEEDDALGLVIYRFVAKETPGIPITRIEVLSPANKIDGSDYETYMRNRRQTLVAGLRLVEVDLLHETPPIIASIPSYVDNETDAFPYSVIVSDPRPSLDAGKTYVYSFVVADNPPKVSIPLEDDDFVVVDFAQVYSATVEGRRAFDLLTNYKNQPDRFHTYNKTDQTYILQMMGKIGSLS